RSRRGRAPSTRRAGGRGGRHERRWTYGFPCSYIAADPRCRGDAAGVFAMRAIWAFLAAIATLLVGTVPVFAEEEEKALTQPAAPLPSAPVAEQRPHTLTL